MCDTLMKKIILLIALMGFLSMKAEAQWYLGGGLGFGTGPNNQFSIYVAPEVGYHFTNSFTIGGNLSYRSGYNIFGVDPYLRWHILKPESAVRIIASIHAPLKFASDYFAYGFFVQPGISIRVAPTARLECHVGAFGWGSATSGATKYSGWEASVNSNNISVGVVFAI